ITGATSGIGRELARQAAANGLSVVAVARRADRLHALADELTRQWGVGVRTIIADLCDSSAIDTVLAETETLDIGLVILNAAAEKTGEFVEGQVTDHVRLAQLNALTPMYMAHHYGKRMRDRGRGGLMFVSSLFAYQGVPYVAHYAATKAYLLSLGESLYVELKPYGVDVLVLSPGLTSTEMTENMPIDFSKLPLIPQQPAQVATVGLQSLGRKATVVSGLITKFMAWENRLMPRTTPVALLGFLIKRALKRSHVSVNQVA
ncbi:MAG: SDR family NAD(P)-dependent oxidoreductase, partial [Nitrospira sp.]|nr:SDR family NAD(P)-dependent oxidoreductase [Nitrospira sp.]